MVYNMKYIKKYMVFEHLKGYKIFESTSDIFDDVSDILSGIEDEDFLVGKKESIFFVDNDTKRMKEMEGITIHIEKMVGDENDYKRSKPYLVNDTILDTVQHLSSYLSKSGYKLVVEAISKTDVIAHQEYYHRDLGDNISSINDLFEFIGRAPIDYLILLIYKHNK